MRARRCAALILPLLFAACDGADSSSGWDVTVTTLPDGASHVLNTPPADAQPTWQLEEELRIGTVDGTGPESFAQLRGLAVLADGSIAVLDGQAQEVRVFGPDGTHRATHGRQGGGPGEFESAFGLMRGADGMLWVPDHRNNRMSVIDPAAGYVTSYPFTFFSYGFIWDGAITDDDRILLPSITLAEPRRNVLRVFGAAPAGGGDTGGMQQQPPPPGLPQELVLLDSLPLPTPPPTTDPKDPPGAFYWESPDGRSRGYMSVPHYPGSKRVIDPRLAVWSTQAGDPAYRISRWVPGGDTTLVIETARAPVEVTQAERDSLVNQFTEMLRERGAARQDWSKIPTTKPAVSAMFLAENGDLWVQTASPDTLRRYDVYTPDGRYTGTAVTPLKIYQWVNPVVRGDQLWAIVTDEMDVPHVVRARLTPVAAQREE